MREQTTRHGGPYGAPESQSAPYGAPELQSAPYGAPDMPRPTPGIGHGGRHSGDGYDAAPEAKRGPSAASSLPFDGGPTTDLPAGDGSLLTAVPIRQHAPIYQPVRREVLEAPLLERIDVRSIGLVAAGAVVGALFVVVVLALVGGDGQSTETAGADLTSAEALADLDPVGPDSSTGDATGGTAALPSSTSTSFPATPSSTIAVTTASTTSTSLTTTSSTVATTAAPATSPTTASTTTTTTPQTTASTAPSTSATAPPSTEASTTTASTAPPTSPTSAASPGPGGDDAAFQQAVLDATNAARAENGCPALRLDPQLNAAADGHSEDMAARNYFDHVSPEMNDPGDRIRAAGYPARGWAENIAAGYRSPEAVVDGWMDSPGHRRNILNCAYEDLGVGFAQPGYYWTQKFGRR